LASERDFRENCSEVADVVSSCFFSNLLASERDMRENLVVVADVDEKTYKYTTQMHQVATHSSHIGIICGG
jgi:hypothetical protein